MPRARPPRASASTPAATPAGATAQCKDGSYSRAQGRSGACAGHGGVATWLSEETPRTTAAPRTSCDSQMPRRSVLSLTMCWSCVPKIVTFTPSANPPAATLETLTRTVPAAFDPIASPSGFENVAAGDRTTNATSTAGFRYGFLSLQTTGYFRRTTPFGKTDSNDSWGYAQQAGYYLVPGRFEIAERISGVNWGGLQFPLAGSSANSWFAGPSFPYHRVDEDSVGLNYYLHGHHAKLQLSYSYLHGNTFSNAKFGASRLWAQTQLMF